MPLKSERRGSAHQRGYTARWRRYRIHFLRANPFCRMCEEAGRTTRATVVDHITPHRGDHRLFWEPENHQPLCKACHDGAKATQERSGYAPGCDAEGNPLDPRHHWNRA